MSTTNLPAYMAPSPSLTRIPSYSAEPHEYEQRIALADRLRPRPTGNFIKKSKNGDTRLRLTAQEDNAALPTYGSQGCVEGIVELSKVDNVTTVEVKIEGRLRLREIAEGGTTSAKLCLDTVVLWRRDPVHTTCPTSLRFSLTLPTTFTYEDKTYPLPPTFDVKLKGLPGFTATIDYSVSATIVKQQFPAASRLPIVKTNILNGSTTVVTPFIYHPRTRPAVPLPPPLVPSRRGFIESPDWSCYHSELRAKGKTGQSITTKLHIPASRIFCISQPIPFHVTFESSVHSLTAFLPYSPTVGFIKAKQATRVQLLRQSTVDVRNSIISGTKTDMWRVDCIGEGSFRHAGDGPTWTSFTGEIKISDSVKVSGFKASGLSVKDCILFSMTPPDPQRSPFHELRQVIPVRLTTDAWIADGTGVGASHQRTGSDYSVASLLDYFEEYMAANESIIDPQTKQASPQLPSQVAPPTRSDTPPQQGIILLAMSMAIAKGYSASTQPGDGSEVHQGPPAPSSPKVPFKEQVLGAAKLLRKPDLKQEGEMILEGQKSAFEEPKTM
ncbi:hypothetical protein D9615_002714 [Tricholomella constricta]|uniref:Uncharacterized protein n=1 Tax=Tricholomella constricta TaxID=117010 RepID=A0A8H5HFR3_9AGAR|nr:hypothetical protein D9615_002714 [Tricholomella constricta]